MKSSTSHITCYLCSSRLSYKFLLPLLLLVITLSSCATDSLRTETQGALLGATVGGVIGKIVGDEKSVIVGAYIGSIVGSKWGVHVASKKSEYANQEAYLEDVIASAELVASDAEAYNKKVTGSIGELEKRQQKLEVSTAEYREQQSQLNKFKSELELALNETNTEIERVAQEIEIQKKVVAIEQDSADPAFVKVAVSGITDLEIQQRALLRALAQLNSIDERREY